MKYLIDSSAWIEYFSGSSSGEKVSKAIESKNEVYTTALNIGEVISLLKRGEDNFEMCYEGIIKRSRHTPWRIKKNNAQFFLSRCNYYQNCRKHTSDNPYKRYAF